MSKSKCGNCENTGIRISDGRRWRCYCGRKPKDPRFKPGSYIDKPEPLYMPKPRQQRGAKQDYYPVRYRIDDGLGLW